MTLITAHAGCDGTPPGSYENLRAARDGHADCIELDLRYYDGRVLLSHDPVDPARLSSYVTLEQALDLLESTALRFNCDLKEEAVFLPALRCFEARRLTSRLDFTGFCPLRQADTGYRVFLNLEHMPAIQEGQSPSAEQLRAAADWFEETRTAIPALCGMNADYTALHAEQLAYLHGRGIPVMCWTVDAHADVEALLRTDVYAITTNEVRFAAHARASL